MSDIFDLTVGVVYEDNDGNYVLYKGVNPSKSGVYDFVSFESFETVTYNSSTLKGMVEAHVFNALAHLYNHKANAMRDIGRLLDEFQKNMKKHKLIVHYLDALEIATNISLSEKRKKILESWKEETSDE